MHTAYQRNGVRRPFGSVNTNTLRVGLGKSSCSGSAHQTVIKPGKSEQKRGGLLSRRGIFTSILSKKSGKTERPKCNAASKLKSPPKKARNDVISHATTTTIFRQSADANTCDDDKFWTDEMEQMLCLKPGKPINETRDDHDTSLDVEVGEFEERDSCDFDEQVRSALMKELSEEDTIFSVNTVPLSKGVIKEHETGGFQLPMNTRDYDCPSDHEAIFRQLPDSNTGDSEFWTVEMEEMLSLRRSRPINESREEDETSLDVEVGDFQTCASSESDEQVRMALVRIAVVEEFSIDDMSSLSRAVSLNSEYVNDSEIDGNQNDSSA